MASGKFRVDSKWMNIGDTRSVTVVVWLMIGLRDGELNVSMVYSRKMSVYKQALDPYTEIHQHVLSHHLCSLLYRPVTVNTTADLDHPWRCVCDDVLVSFLVFWSRIYDRWPDWLTMIGTLISGSRSDTYFSDGHNSLFFPQSLGCQYQWYPTASITKNSLGCCFIFSQNWHLIVVKTSWLCHNDN